jgi:hypothetical protein
LRRARNLDERRREQEGDKRALKTSEKERECSLRRRGNSARTWLLSRPRYLRNYLLYIIYASRRPADDLTTRFLAVKPRRNQFSRFSPRNRRERSSEWRQRKQHPGPGASYSNAHEHGVPFLVRQHAQRRFTENLVRWLALDRTHELSCIIYERSPFRSRCSIHLDVISHNVSRSWKYTPFSLMHNISVLFTYNDQSLRNVNPFFGYDFRHTGDIVRFSLCRLILSEDPTRQLRFGSGIRRRPVSERF